jgi:hypothetical protein
VRGVRGLEVNEELNDRQRSITRSIYQRSSSTVPAAPIEPSTLSVKGGVSATAKPPYANQLYTP